MTIKPLLFAAAIALTGCGAHGLAPTAAVRSASPVAARAIAAVTPAQLAAGWDAPENEGRRVTLTASFVPHTYALGYGETCHGYLLQGPEGGAVRCANVGRVVRMGVEEGRDFSATARAGLAAQAAVTVKGVFHASHSASSHGGVYTVPASVEVTAIDGKPLSAYLTSAGAAH